MARPISRQPLVGLAAQHQPAGSRLTLERVLAVVRVWPHPLADRVDDAVDGGLRRRDQLSHLDSPSVTGPPSGPCGNASNADALIRRLSDSVLARVLVALLGVHRPAGEAREAGSATGADRARRLLTAPATSGVQCDRYSRRLPPRLPARRSFPLPRN